MFYSVTVANTILYKAFLEGKEITPLQLQGMLYFLSSHYAKTTNNRLIHEDFETWTYCPVLSSVNQKFRLFQGYLIDPYAKGIVGKADIVNLTENRIFNSALTEVYEATIDYDGVFLSTATRQKGSAWDKANQSKSPTLDWLDIKNDTSYYKTLPTLTCFKGGGVSITTIIRERIKQHYDLHLHF